MILYWEEMLLWCAIYLLQENLAKISSRDGWVNMEGQAAV